MTYVDRQIMIVSRARKNRFKLLKLTFYVRFAAKITDKAHTSQQLAVCLDFVSSCRHFFGIKDGYFQSKNLV